MGKKRKILITGAGSGVGEGVAIGLARLGHTVIAGGQISPQVTALRNKVVALGLQDYLRVEKLDILSAFDVANALKWDVDILFNHAGIGEAGPISEIPLELVRSNFETNVFAPLSLSQHFIAKWITGGIKGKIVFTSSLLALLSVRGLGVYEATKHALEAVAEELHGEMKPYGIQVQVFNPGAFFTGFNETMAETPFRWLNDQVNFTNSAALRAELAALFNSPDRKLDPQILIDAMVALIPAETGKFRNVIPASLNELVNAAAVEIWQREL